MADEVVWREEDGRYLAEVNDWGVTVERRTPTTDFLFEWSFTVLAKCGCCGKVEFLGFALKATESGAKTEGIEWAARHKPPEGFVPMYHGENAKKVT